ncbi:carotenoid biosynthesis protein [Methanobacterium sp. SMA-27]|uniref:carotenoid biosynthesis protein n=1 Tax=Methanobacterium sp. SMA-27 TaxID=1495336 RepID=UPI00064E671C|nr:carotenoid biosynthesis protein [Methanobacterium sp. SMA-27]
MEIIFYIKLLVVLSAVALILIIKPLQLKKTVYPIYFGFLIITFLSYIYSLMGTNNLVIDFIGSLWIFTGLALVVIHSSILLGKTKTALFFSIALIFGLVSEVLGVKFGWIYGHYYYNPILTPAFFGLVPVVNVISWAFIIYISYIFADIILEFNNKKFYLKNKGRPFVFLLIILLSMISGMVATNMDMLIDPVVVANHAWFWIDSGPYFGIPISNFVGWFLVVFSVTFLFRVVEFIIDKKDHIVTDNSFLTATIISMYTMFLLIYGYTALLIGHPEYLLIGTTAMGPFILITILITYIKHTRVGKNE